MRRAVNLVSAWLGLLMLSSAACADAGWFESGDAQLRIDLQLLNDAEIIRLPVNQWPMPRASVEYALANARDHIAVNRAVLTALDRVRSRVAKRSGARFGAWVAAGEPGLLRDFDSFARERAEAGARADWDTGRVSVSLKVAAVANPADDRHLRADGSHATLQLGNWLLSANTLESR